jgi:Poly(A) RNA polymerase, mitochondrial-like, central palm domain
MHSVQQQFGALSVRACPPSARAPLHAYQSSSQEASGDFTPHLYYVNERVRNLRDPQGRRKPRRTRKQRRDNMRQHRDSDAPSWSEVDEVAEEAAAAEAEEAEATRLALRAQVSVPVSALPLRYPADARVQHLQEDLLAVYNTLVPPPRDIELRLNLLTRLRTLVGRCFRNNNPKLMLFGSTASDLCCRGGDVDLCLLIDKSAGTSKRVINRLAGLLRKSKSLLVLLALSFSVSLELVNS